MIKLLRKLTDVHIILKRLVLAVKLLQPVFEEGKTNFCVGFASSQLHILRPQHHMGSYLVSRMEQMDAGTIATVLQCHSTPYIWHSCKLHFGLV